MKIAVMGTGGVGGYFGARLAAAGNDVTFIARGAHLAAIRARGLTVTSANGDMHVHPARATDNPATVGPADAVLFTVKAWDTEEAANAIRPMVTPQTAVVPFQNGIDAIDGLTAVLGPTPVLGGSAYIAAVIAEPALIRHTGTMARIVFGEVDGQATERTATLLAECEKAGVDATVSPDIRKTIWEKFASLASLAGVTSLTQANVGGVRNDPGHRAMLEAAVAEVIAVGRSQGIALTGDLTDKIMKTIDRFPDGMRTSMQQDLERGSRLELPWLSGAVVRLGTAAGVPTPTHARVLEALLPHAEGRKSG
jgi:2-dehydropantoate 2-reductase